MCPDKQLLSVYHDGELPSPWKEKMETHLASCAACRSALVSYGTLSASLRTEPEAVEEAFSGALARVREKLPEAGRRRLPSPIRRLVSRRVAVPLPFAAVAAAALVFAAALVITERGGMRRIPDAGTVAEGINLSPQGIRRVSSMDDALRLIENNEFFAGPSGSYVIMRLPENKTFRNLGNPLIQNTSAGSFRGGSGE
jgi:hypothetical protein